MYHPIAATCPSDMVVRVRKVLANRGLLILVPRARRFLVTW